MKKIKLSFIFFIASGLALCTMSACSTDDNPILPVLNDENSTTELATIVVPPGEKIFYDFKTGALADSAQSMINLSGMYGSSLNNSQAGTYTMGYFDKEKAPIDALKLADVLNASITPTDAFSIDASSAGAPATGPTWIIYDFKNNHA